MSKKLICDQCLELKKQQAKKRKAQKQKREFKKLVRRGFILTAIVAISSVILGAVF